MHTVIGSTAAFSLNDFKARAVASARDVFLNSAHRLDPRAESFLEQLQDDAVAEDLAGLTIDDVIALAASLWSWASARAPHETRVRGGVGRGAGGREINREIIEIVTDNKPFLVDSVMGEINAQGHDVLAMFHPIVPPATEDGPEASIIQVHLDVLSEAERDRLVDALQGVLADVEIAVADHTAMRAAMDRAIVELQRAKTTASPEELAEAVAFLEWMRDDHFAFLGSRAYEFLTDGKGGFIRDEPEIVLGSELGLLRDHDRHVLRRGSEPVLITSAVEEFLREPSPVIVAKSNMRSRVHRRAHMDYVGVKRYDERGEVKGETRFVGLFTANAYNVRVRDVPLIRRKVRRVFERAVRSPDGHSDKQLANILETYPRDELFQMTEDEILDIARGVLHVFDRPRTKLFIRRDRFDRFLSILAYIPRDRFNSQLREKIGQTIADAFGGRVSAYYPYFGAGALARVHFIIGLDPDHPEPDIPTLEAEVVALSRTWEDEFARVARLEAPSKLRPRLPSYENAFSAGYREAFTPEEALDDALAIESIDPIVGLGVRAFRDPADEPNALRLKVYHESRGIELSDVLPTLEAMGLHVQSETSHAVRRAPAEEGGAAPPAVWVHEFKMISGGGPIDIDAVKTPFEDAFIAIWTGATESDGFNRLVLELGASWREVCFLRACARFRQQTGLDPSQQIQEQALADHPGIARLLLELKTVRLDPAFAGDKAARLAQSRVIEAEIVAELEKVESLDADRVLRRLMRLILSVLRTNFYQTDPDGWFKPAIAIKIASDNLEELPEPKPYREIYVWSPRVEGVHIRFGPVARGGIRWSDRQDDFRTEVLGLVKAQFVKNAVIVPVGAKGGFYPKALPKPTDRAAWLEEGTASYKLFISSLLDVTDNIVEDRVVHPHKAVVWDREDPYLVVAADKGTAAFSDLANEISEARGFWLGDAFASGGSAGYDHKKMGITARGAWEAVKRHFRETGKDIQSEDFTVIGVGDMSGDVFGNGMLLSKHIRLIAAFDHRDIFIDPDPGDREACWNERKRLFDMERSSWADYDQSLISRGGGVFSRSKKSVALTPEIKALTGLAEDAVAPSELIRALLKTPCELLWFGGIGAYIKASGETDAQVGDKFNDAVRITAEEAGAAVIGEGANLGVTQAGRVELARRGVRLNADFIDNAAGVGSSDYEVNIKILLNPVLKAGRLSREARDSLLESMTDDVANHVLASCYDQTLAISMAERSSVEDLDANERLIERLEARGVLNRRVEGLPTSDQFRELREAGLGLTRPELSILVSYAKISLFDRIVASPVPDDPHFDRLLEAYFPDELARYGEQMRGHRLRREIIATVLANDFVNLGGATFSHRAREATGGSTADVARAFEAARRIFGFSDLIKRINALDNAAPAEVQHDLYAAVIMLLRRQTFWLVRRGLAEGEGRASPLRETIEAYKPGVAELRKIALDLISPFERERVEKRAQRFIDGGAPETLAHDVARLQPLTSSTDVIGLAAKAGAPLAPAARIYHAVGEGFRFDELRAVGGEVSSSSHWDRLAVRRLMEDLYADQQKIAGLVLASAPKVADDETWAHDTLEAWIDARRDEVARLGEQLDEFAGGEWTLSKLTLSATALRDFVGRA